MSKSVNKTAAKSSNALPEGFSPASETSSAGIVFQNAAAWARADVTGRMVQGTYLGTLEKDTYGKCNHKFLSAIDGTTINKDGDAVDFKAGTTVIINSSGSLDKQLLNSKIGDEVVVDYTGKIKMLKGPFKGKEANTFLVGIKRSSSAA